MLPRHQAAIDMAKTELAFGKDPQMRGESVESDRAIVTAGFAKEVDVGNQ
jgi:hypothetical protein